MIATSDHRVGDGLIFGTRRSHASVIESRGDINPIGRHRTSNNLYLEIISSVVANSRMGREKVGAHATNSNEIYKN